MTGRWGFISAHRADFGVQRICRVLGVSRSGCYRWRAGAAARAERRADDDALVAEVREVHAEHRGTYGVRRVHAGLRGLGHTVNRKRVERLMRREGIEGRHLRRRKRTTTPDRFAPPAPDLVRRDFTAAVNWTHPPVIPQEWRAVSPWPAALSVLIPRTPAAFDEGTGQRRRSMSIST